MLTSGEVGSLRIVAASIFLLPFALKRIKKVNRRDWKFLLSVGFVGSLFPSFLFAIAQTRLESSVTGVLNALTPIFTILIGLFIYGQKQPGRVFAGIFVGFIGTAILILAGAEGAVSLNFYAFFVVLATLFYGTNLNIIKYHLSHQRALTITSISLMLVGPISLLYLWGATDYFQKILEVEGAVLSSLYIIILGVLGTAIALILFNKLVQITDPVFTSSVTYIIPIVAVVWGLIDGERLYLMHYLGMTGIILGVYLANKSRRLHLKNKIKYKETDQADQKAGQKV